jgi:hypothetical protein
MINADNGGDWRISTRSYSLDRISNPSPTRSVPHAYLRQGGTNQPNAATRMKTPAAT